MHRMCAQRRRTSRSRSRRKGIIAPCRIAICFLVGFCRIDASIGGRSLVLIRAQASARLGCKCVQVGDIVDCRFALHVSDLFSCFDDFDLIGLRNDRVRIALIFQFFVSESPVDLDKLSCRFVRAFRELSRGGGGCRLSPVTHAADPVSFVRSMLSSSPLINSSSRCHHVTFIATDAWSSVESSTTTTTTTSFAERRAGAAGLDRPRAAAHRGRFESSPCVSFVRFCVMFQRCSNTVLSPTGIIAACFVRSFVRRPVSHRGRRESGRGAGRARRTHHSRPSGHSRCTISMIDCRACMMTLVCW